ncbi:MAG: hypothetical protein ACRD5L_13280, partial [Bryobacteraceae bacterium]
MARPDLKMAALSLLAAACLLGVAGCDDTAMHAVAVRPNALAAPQAARATRSGNIAQGSQNGAEARKEFTPYPVDASRARVASLNTPPASAEDLVLAYAQAKFDLGEQDYRAGHLSKARHDFDLAT